MVVRRTHVYQYDKKGRRYVVIKGKKYYIMKRRKRVKRVRKVQKAEKNDVKKLLNKYDLTDFYRQYQNMTQPKSNVPTERDQSRAQRAISTAKELLDKQMSYKEEKKKQNRSMSIYIQLK